MIKNLPTQLAVTAAVVILSLSASLASALPQAKAISFFYCFNLYLGKLYSFGLASLASKVFLHDSYDSIWNDALADNIVKKISFLEISSKDFHLDFVPQTIHKSRTVIPSNISLYARGNNLLEIFTGAHKSDDKTLAEIDLSIASAKDGYSYTVRNSFSTGNKTVDLWRLIWLMVRS